MSSSNNVVVSYSPTDFFYIMANDVMPNESSCNNSTIGYKLIPDASCVPFPNLSQEFLKQKDACEAQDKRPEIVKQCLQNEDTKNNGTTSYSNTYAVDYPKWKQWHDLSMNCYKKELCKNKDNATSINNLQNNHLGSDQNYENTKALYMNEFIKTIHLSIGVVILVAAIFYSNK